MSCFITLLVRTLILYIQKYENGALLCSHTINILRTLHVWYIYTWYIPITGQCSCNLLIWLGWLAKLSSIVCTLVPMVKTFKNYITANSCKLLLSFITFKPKLIKQTIDIKCS